MKRVSTILIVLLASTTASAADDPQRAKRRLTELVEAQRDVLVPLSESIWAWAETALREQRSAEALAAAAERQGFRVERGVAGMPTAFVATYGSGRPIVGILAEYDALPGISQRAVTERSPLVEGGAGHGCGHNLFGVGSLGAALALKEILAESDQPGTVRLYGTPAEESVGGKLYMIRSGLFDDLDAALAWHPDTTTGADTASSQAMVELGVQFEGRAAHAAYDPWNGRSAVDAAEIFTHALNLMREHVRPTVRMHYSWVQGGDVPNVVPEKARLWVWLRDSTHQSVDLLLERIRTMVEGAALAADVEGSLELLSGDWEMLANLEGAQLLHRNLQWLGPPVWSDEEQDFARRLQESVGVETSGMSPKIEPLDLEPGEPEGGSTDVADVSWRVPTIHLTVATAPLRVPWHAWPVVAASGTSLGQTGMLYAAKALAATAYDLLVDEEALDAVRSEFEKKTAGVEPGLYLPDGPPPVPELQTGATTD